MEKSIINSLLDINANGRGIFSDLKASVSPSRNPEMGQNIFSLSRTGRVQNHVGINSIAKVGHCILKIIATLAISVFIILGVVGFFPLVMTSNNVLLDVMIPLCFYQGICVFAIYYMWTPMKGWGTH